MPGARQHERVAWQGRCWSILVGLTPALIASACSTRAGVPLPATEQGQEVLSLWRVLFWAAVGVGALVLGLMAWCLLRYRRRKGDADGLPPQTPGNLRMEIAYTLAPLVLAGVLFGLAWRTDVRTSRMSARPDLRVDVTGFQWQWRFDYPGEGVTTVGAEDRPPELVLPANRTVRFRLVAADVIHSFYVPEFLVKRDLVPGRPVELELRPNRTGRFAANCAEFCGLNHSFMGFDVRVVSHQEFLDWAGSHRADRVGAQP